MSRREIELLKKLKGGVCTNKKGEWICDGDLAMSKKEVEEMLKLLKAKKKKIVEAKKLGPDAFDRETGNLIKSCRRAGLHEMPNPNGVIMDLLQEGSLVEKVVEDKYWDTTRKEMVRCVNDTSLQAINRFLRNADNIGDVKATMDSKYEDLLTKIEMLEQNMELVKPFVTGHPEMGKMGAPLKLRKKGGGGDRTVEVAWGIDDEGNEDKNKEINTCAASTTRSSCEAKRHSLYGEAGEACLWMPNFNHLTEQALNWEKTSHKKTGSARMKEKPKREHGRNFRTKCASRQRISHSRCAPSPTPTWRRSGPASRGRPTRSAPWSRTWAREERILSPRTWETRWTRPRSTAMPKGIT